MTTATMMLTNINLPLKQCEDKVFTTFSSSLHLFLQCSTESSASADILLVATRPPATEEDVSPTSVTLYRISLIQGDIPLDLISFSLSCQLAHRLHTASGCCVVA